jgi:2-octaprenyl-6-methoxyphenol hydroxylase
MNQNYATMQPGNHATIVIVGGGLVGLSQAIALAGEGFEVTVIDREVPDVQLQPEFDGRTCAIAWKSYKFLDKIGVWQYIAEFAEPIKDIRVSEFKSPLFVHFDHSEIGTDPFGFIVENRHIRYALFKRAAELAGLKIIAPASLLEIENGKLTIEHNHQSAIINYQLLIVADGKNSKTRDMLGIKASRSSYNQTAIVCTIKHEKPHMGLAYEHFIPTGPFAVLPLSQNRSSLVWAEPNDLAPVYMKMNEADFNAEIAKRINYLGKIEALPGRWSYPLELVLAKQYVKGNAVLVGDAAHGIHPIAGQGVNLGFRDIEDLTNDLVLARKLGLEPNLAAYERKRKLDNMLMIQATDKLTKLFSNNIIPIKLAREAGLGLVNQIPPLRRFFMKYAAGHTVV